MPKIKKSVTLDEEVLEGVEEHANEDKRSVSNYVNQVLREHLELG